MMQIDETTARERRESTPPRAGRPFQGSVGSPPSGDSAGTCASGGADVRLRLCSSGAAKSVDGLASSQAAARRGARWVSAPRHLGVLCPDGRCSGSAAHGFGCRISTDVRLARTYAKVHLANCTRSPIATHRLERDDVQPYTGSSFRLRTQCRSQSNGCILAAKICRWAHQRTICRKRSR